LLEQEILGNDSADTAGSTELRGGHRQMKEREQGCVHREPA
jgi:hypothetical protein